MLRPCVREPLVRATPGPGRFRILPVGNQHFRAQPRRPNLQLMGHAVRAVLDIARREQRQNALFDLLDELAVSGCRDRVALGCEFDRLPVRRHRLRSRRRTLVGSRLQDVHPDPDARERIRSAQ